MGAGVDVKLLVTGGAGYVGSIVAHHLIAGGNDVVVLDDRAHVPGSAGHQQFLASTPAPIGRIHAAWTYIRTRAPRTPAPDGAE